MNKFFQLNKEFESTNDIVKFTNDFKDQLNAMRFMLIRSLDAKSVKKILGYKNIKYKNKKLFELMNVLFETDVSVECLVTFIKGEKQKLIEERKNELSNLDSLLKCIPIVQAGIRDDKVDGVIQQFVRNKNIKSFDEFENELNSIVLPRIKNYAYWSYYNQTSNDIIELHFLKHNKVIPTLRKIHDIDFFIEVEDSIIPFDLKVTHISDSYFDIARQGIVKNNNNKIYDDFVVKSTNKTEIEEIKDFYKSNKKQYKLPNYGSLKKSEMVNEISKIDSSQAKNFIAELKERRSSLIPAGKDLKKLEWWNYKYQGERLFSNNNRIFIFLAYFNQFKDARELKGDVDEIGKIIKNLLDNISLDKINRINYYYDKDLNKSGNYTANSISDIYIK